VTKPASRSAKNSTARATSSASPSRFTGIACAIFSTWGLPSGTTLWKLAVRIGPGATTLTVMPDGASSSAQVRAMPSIPALVAE